MKMRDSGMPDETYWETLLDVPLILERMGLNGLEGDVVELGCGYGTFTLPLAPGVTGTVLVLDVDPDMVRRTRRRADEAGRSNIICRVRDVMEEGFGVENASQAAALLFNILHCEQPVALLREAARVVRPGGWVLVIHWRHDTATPRGPSLDIRPRPEQITAWACQSGELEWEGEVIALPPWHYGLRFRRTAVEMRLPA